MHWLAHAAWHLGLLLCCCLQSVGSLDNLNPTHSGTHFGLVLMGRVYNATPYQGLMLTVPWLAFMFALPARGWLYKWVPQLNQCVQH